MKRPDQARVQKYCSRKCSDAHYNTTFLSGRNNGRWRGGKAMNYGPGWKKIKELVRERDQVCRHCGKTREENGRALDVHHLDPYRWSLNNALENLIALCRSCHMRADDNGRRRSVTFLRGPVEPKRPTRREIRRLRQLTRAAEARARRRVLQRRAREMKATGASLREIEAALGVSRQTINNWFHGSYLVEESAASYDAPPWPNSLSDDLEALVS